MPDVQPHQFQDRQQRAWNLELDYALMRKIKAQTQTDLGNLNTFGQVWAELYLDQDRTLRIVWFCIAAAAQDQAITEDDWILAMDDNTLDDAYHALGVAVANFTRPQNRRIVEESISTIQQGLKAATDKAANNIRTETASLLEQFGSSQPNAQES